VTSGPVLFARYAYPPNALGYCGPADPLGVLERAGTPDPAGTAALARQFAGAWPYLCLIAAANGARNPLADRVVEAYWVGNDLLERVPAGMLAAHVTDRFSVRAGRGGPHLGTLAASGGRAHHNFHVFSVYPWVGLLREGTVDEPMRVLQSCRIRWGRVVSVHGGLAQVCSPPLEWTGRELVLGPARVEQVTIASPGGRLAGEVRVGDVVSMHWDWVCDVLDARGLAALRRYTLGQLRVTNTALRRPAVDRVLG
jgi:hypothetical protein